MKKEILFEILSLYRDDFRINGYTFGDGEKSACIVGSTRGNENQQLYICSKLVQTLAKFEEMGLIEKGKQILVVPTANSHSANIKKRFWGIDNTDINRMFPGYDKGETTQRIAGGLFEKIKDYQYGVQFASFYMPGDFVPHVRVMRTEVMPNEELVSLAKDFGLRYVVSHEPRPYDTATLNFNWQIWETNAFSLYTTTTESIDKVSAEMAIRGILNFLSKRGILKYTGGERYVSQTVKTEEICTVRSKHAGFFDSFVCAGDTVRKGQLLAEITHSGEGHVVGEIISPVDGTIFFARNDCKMYQNTAVYKIIPEFRVY